MMMPVFCSVVGKASVESGGCRRLGGRPAPAYPPPGPSCPRAAAAAGTVTAPWQIAVQTFYNRAFITPVSCQLSAAPAVTAYCQALRCGEITRDINTTIDNGPPQMLHIYTRYLSQARCRNMNRSSEPSEMHTWCIELQSKVGPC